MLSVPTGRNPQQSLHGPAPSLAQASPCAGAACPQWRGCGEGHSVLPGFLPASSGSWCCYLVEATLALTKGSLFFVFQAALAPFPGPLGAPLGARGVLGQVLSVSPPAQLSRTAQSGLALLSASPPVHPSSQIPGEQLFSQLHTPSNPQLNQL